MKKVFLIILLATSVSTTVLSSETKGGVSVTVLTEIGMATATIHGEAARSLYELLDTPATLTNPQIKVGVNFSCTMHSYSDKQSEYQCSFIALPDGSLSPDEIKGPVGGFTISN